MKRHQNVAGPHLEERLGQKRLAVYVRDARANRPVHIRETKPGQRETRAVGIVVQKRLVRIAVHGHERRTCIVVGAVRVRVLVVDAAHRAPRRQVKLKHKRGVSLRAFLFRDGRVVPVAPVAARRRGGDGDIGERRGDSDRVLTFAVRRGDSDRVLTFAVRRLLSVTAERRSPARDERGDVEHRLHAP